MEGHHGQALANVHFSGMYASYSCRCLPRTQAGKAVRRSEQSGKGDSSSLTAGVPPGGHGPRGGHRLRQRMSSPVAKTDKPAEYHLQDLATDGGALGVLSCVAGELASRRGEGGVCQRGACTRGTCHRALSRWVIGSGGRVLERHIVCVWVCVGGGGAMYPRDMS